MDDLLPAAYREEGPALVPAHVECPFGSVEVAADVFSLFGGIAGELAVFPVGGEVLEFVGGHLVVGCITGLMFLCKDRRAFYWTTARRENSARPFFFHDPEDLIHPVNSPVAERSIGVVQVLPEASRMNTPTPGIFGVAIVGPQWGWAAPHVPIQAFGRFHVLLWLFRAASI